ncbi:MAG TPA: ACT domain-containing protein, partial [Silvibacterium sp.]|nr:ACT domain-containing protein [Silvibacterium sp.]
TAIISDEGTNIRTVDSRPGPNADAIVEFVVEAQDVRQLTKLVQGMRRVPGVRDVQRSQKL